MKTSDQARKRPYAMGARAEAAAATGERILDATEQLFWSVPLDQVLLEEIASRSGVTVQTVIRRYGGKEGVIAAAAERARSRVTEQRNSAPVGDLEATAAVLMDHYEEHGDRSLRLLHDEGSSPTIAQIVADGRELHREWCRRMFAPTLAALGAAARKRRLAALVAICDVYTWKLLRHDSGLSRAQAQTALIEMLEPLTGSA